MNYLTQLSLSVAMMMASSALADCQALLTNKISSDMTLSYEQFDQTTDSGWRSLEAQGCYLEAAQLIEAWQQNHPKYPNSLNWHLLQQYAYANQNDKALALVPQVLLTEQRQQVSPLQWNAYVLATAAFLQRDLQKLKFHRAELAAKANQLKPNEINLAAVDRLINGFHLSYQQAYDGALPMTP